MDALIPSSCAQRTQGEETGVIVRDLGRQPYVDLKTNSEGNSVRVTFRALAELTVAMAELPCPESSLVIRQPAAAFAGLDVPTQTRGACPYLAD